MLIGLPDATAERLAGLSCREAIAFRPAYPEHDSRTSDGPSEPNTVRTSSPAGRSYRDAHVE